VIDTAAESALLAIRNRLHALDIPADEVPDDLLDVAVGGSLMPSLPGWTPARARDWAAVAVRWPEVARRVVAWCEANAGRLANLEGIVASLDQTAPLIFTGMVRVDPDGQRRFDVDWLILRRPESIEPTLDLMLSRLNHIPRPWHAELTAAIAAARRGALPATTFHLTDWTRSGSQPWAEAGTVIPVYPLETVANIRVAPPILDDILGRTNAASFCGAEPDELILQALGTELGEWDSRDGPRIHLRYHFGFRPGYPWSRFPNPDGSWRILRDENGYRPFMPADFYELP
jgi:hypothetical protein